MAVAELRNPFFATVKLVDARDFLAARADDAINRGVSATTARDQVHLTAGNRVKPPQRVWHRTPREKRLHRVGKAPFSADFSTARFDFFSRQGTA